MTLIRRGSGRYTDDELRVLLRTESLIRVCPGVYVDAQLWRASTPDEKYRLRIHAALGRRSSRSVASHHSAAAVLDLATLHPDRSRVHVSVNGHGGGRSTSRCVEHRVSLDDIDCVDVGGLRVTGAARTALDLACIVSRAQALCVVESAYRAGAVDLVGVLDRMGRRDGIARARTAAELASPLTESIGESWSRALMLDWPEIPEPRLQHRFFNGRGVFVARSDFDWKERLVGEFDGLGKYADRESLVREKLREDALRAMGIHVVRWTWADLQQSERLRRLLNDALDRAFPGGRPNR
ncbi:MAG: hypothetical protein WBA00_09130 [Rhodococcus sp. (in: high G+C Gram-positive bacteria)]